MMVKCSQCGKEHEIRKQQYEYKRKWGKKDFFCDQKCSGKYYGNGFRI